MIYLLLVFTGFCLDIDVERTELRKYFINSYESKSDAKHFLELANSIESDSDLNKKGYQGIAYLMNSKYGYNPIKKLKTFKKGKTLLDEAIIEDELNLELRFYRMSVQMNVPKILNYQKNIKEDKTIILDHLQTIEDEELLKMIRSYLYKCECLDRAEFIKLEKT